ncbi:hypothetical protein TSOC_004382 [Tetrabaena socialis]|uniref:Uncharacterized protein n=1 Tax=Tetrabaena socialis TaxID=47790 RepID=A0A2J8A933_9CHLO|nr:hypothetical protein TSOC_004382 [Tetrabaena socialis]|eukprot:PNH09042.1 hypothetical protein TSOC_004382 [Tetrabaena socialis]
MGVERRLGQAHPPVSLLPDTHVAKEYVEANRRIQALNAVLFKLAKAAAKTAWIYSTPLSLPDGQLGDVAQMVCEALRRVADTTWTMCRRQLDSVHLVTLLTHHQPQQHFPQRSKLPNGLTGAAPGSSNGAAPSNARTPPLPGRIPSSTMLHPSGPASSTTASQPGHAGAGGVAGSVRFPTRQASSSSLLRSTTPSPTSSYGGGLDLDLDLELQVLNADREVLHDQLVASETANERLTAQVADLRQKVAGYESLTRQAASELAEIRQLKDAFQARLQRETDALRAQLLQAGIAPAAAPHQQQQRHAAHPGDAPLAPSHAEAAAAAASRAPQATPSGLMQPQQQPQHKLSQHQQQQQRYGVQSMAAFGSPAMLDGAATVTSCPETMKSR